MNTLQKLPIVLFLVLFTFSCNTDENSEDAIPAEQIANSTFTKTAFYQNPIFLKGNFKNVSTHNHEILLYTETLHQKHIFHVQTNEAFQFNEKINEIAYLNDGILINNSVFIGVKGNVSNQLITDVNAISKNNIKVNLTAKSLSYFWTPKENKNYEDIDYYSPTLQRQVPEIVDTDGKGKCDHGGEGSTSCSLTNGNYGSCSVSCGTGYYACCVKGSWSTKQSCHCKQK
ncbi:hypothetical protein KORDIASMS9_02637 [Kordia sp. SMS9]|uniref:hypothetical protein n=1 Tax=Kordia sp. SMS9 TaxID=2282170 RepID=UPI000E0D841E|nr:hypothetical protein [Kordia sp. SMS9]AXG70397.1 hypothetical protein KORDIASMS9_02637 [Kordia sp. SMS9]